MEVINEKQKKFAINFIMYIITFCFLCLIGITRTFAYTYTTIGDKANVTVVLVSTDYLSQPVNVPINSSYNFNQVLQVDYLVNNYNFEANKHYQLESHLTRQTFTNANAYKVIGLNGESCLIDYTASVFSGSYPRWDFECPHATDSITLSIYNNANQYLWDNGVYTWTTALLSYSNERIPVSSDTQDIINNNNQNTQNIINNNNQNTQDIINSNTVCDFITWDDVITTGVVFNNVGESSSAGSSFGITDYIKIGKSITVTKFYDYWISTCFYDTNKNLISCVRSSSMTLNDNLTIPSNAYYVRFSMHKVNGPEFKLCKNGNQALNDSINNLDDTINDDDTTDAENEASEFFNSFSTETFGLTSIITAPLNLIRSVIGEGSICTTLNLPLPYLDNKSLQLPCMTTIYQQYFGSFFTLYQTITYGIVAYWVIVRIFNQVKDFKNPEHDEIEVMDL